MNANEKIRVEYFVACTAENDCNEGCKPTIDSEWDSNIAHFDTGRRFDSVRAALEAVCKANGFEFDPNSWEKREGESCFDGCFMVDENTSEATRSEIEAWKNGEKRLWTCNLAVKLVAVVERDLVDEELAI